VRRERIPAAVALALALVQAGLLAGTAWDKSDTADEPTYIVAGTLLWTHRDYSFNYGAPVLPKWGFALALRAVDPAIRTTPEEWYRAGIHMLWSGRPGRLHRNLFAARCATIFVTVLGACSCGTPAGVSGAWRRSRPTLSGASRPRSSPMVPSPPSTHG
jgi:hypothetical protein